MVLGLGLLVAFVVLAGPGQTRTLSRETALATFDTAWELVYTTHFDTTFNGVDWLALRDELRPTAGEATSQQELRRVIWDMLLRLRQSHFGIIPGEPAEAFAPDTPLEGEAGDERVLRLLFSAVPKYRGMAGPGFEIVQLDDDILVYRRWSTLAPEKVGLGWRLVAIDGRSLDASFAFLEAELAQRLPDAGLKRLKRPLSRLFVQTKLAGKPGTDVRVTFEDGTGTEREVLFRRFHGPGVTANFGGMPPMRTEVTGRWEPVGDLRVAVLFINAWMPPVNDLVPAVLDTMGHADALVLDLRSNPGGVGRIAQALASHLVKEKTSLGRFASRDGGYPLTVRPRLRGHGSGSQRNTFDGPVVVLTDGATGSTSEVFTAGMKDLGRIRVIGEPTAGAALPARISPLPNGDSLLHATFDFLRPSGQSVEGNPIVPDQEVPLLRSDLLAERDRALEAALLWCAEAVATREVVVD